LALAGWIDPGLVREKPNTDAARANTRFTHGCWHELLQVARATPPAFPFAILQSRPTSRPDFRERARQKPLSIRTIPPRQRPGTVKFILGMTLLAAVFVGFILLGNWQVRRYHLKLRIASDIATRVHAPPVAAPGPAHWPRIAAGGQQYLHVRLRGHFTGSQTLVHGSSSKGYGYWVMAPLRTERGFIVLVNRGYVPAELPGTPTASIAPPDGEVTLTGLLRASEPRGGFLRHNDPAAKQWSSRDVSALAAADHLPADRVAPYFVDAGATGNAGEPPIAGLTNIHIYNHSLGYAITWYLLALGTLLAAGILVRHEWQSRRGQSP
jgi:surfeit locus 1 family protein